MVMWACSSSGQRFRPLRLVGVIRAGVDLELSELLRAKAGVGHHTLHRATDGLFGTALHQVTERLLLVPARVAAVPRIDLGVELVAADGDLRGVEHDHVIAAVQVGRVGRLVLAHEDAGDPRREPAERLVRRVDDVPASLDLRLPERIRLRGHVSPFISRATRPMTTRRRQSPFAGATAPWKAGCRDASASATADTSTSPRPTSRSAATIRLTICRRKASPRTSTVTRRPSRRTRTP